MTDPWAAFRRSRRFQAAGLVLGGLALLAVMIGRFGSVGAVIASLVFVCVGGVVFAAAIAWFRSGLRRVAPDRLYGCSAILLQEEPEKPVEVVFWIEQNGLEWRSLLKRTPLPPVSLPLSQIASVNTTHLGWPRRLGIEVAWIDGQRSHFVASAKQRTVVRLLAAVGVSGDHQGPGCA